MPNGGIIGNQNTPSATSANGVFKLEDVFLGTSNNAWTGTAQFSFLVGQSFNFTNATASGKLGPTLAQCQSEYSGVSWAQNTSNLTMTSQGIQLWTVPVTGTYGIDAIGAQGGNGNSSSGGLGARIYGKFSLNKGDVLKVLVGQVGPNTPHSQNSAQRLGGGGGGTFVTKNDNTILVIAGGGGGGVSDSWSGTVVGGNAVTGNSGNSSQNGVYAGGSGGGGAQNGPYAGPGAGYSGNSSAPSGTGGGDVAYSFLNGGQGGRQSLSWGDQGGYGGFGGGGGGGGLSSGGGGGYSGGASGQWSSQEAGGGGGSYNNGSSQTNEIRTLTNGGNGYVCITRLS